MCTIRILKNDYDDVIQPPKAASEAGKFVGEVCVNGTPVHPRCPTGGDGTSPPCERKHNVTPKVSSVTPSSCWMVIDS